MSIIYWDRGQTVSCSPTRLHPLLNSPFGDQSPNPWHRPKSIFVWPISCHDNSTELFGVAEYLVSVRSAMELDSGHQTTFRRLWRLSVNGTRVQI